MRLSSVILKSSKEQLRSYWVLLLSLVMGPFFILVYYLIVESSRATYDVIVINKDVGFPDNVSAKNYGAELILFIESSKPDSFPVPLNVTHTNDAIKAENDLKNKKADALVIIPETFSSEIIAKSNNPDTTGIAVTVSGDLTSSNYLISAIWVNELLNEYLYQVTGTKPLTRLTETPLGTSGTMDDFDMIVPGILIVSIIMLMFTASIAFVSEVENKTIMRLRLSRLKALEFLGGIGIVQSVVGVLSVVLTLITALSLGFEYQGSLLIMVLIATLTSLSIIAFSLIIAALTKSANEVLIVGNFPMFLFMFFTGAAFPIKSEALFSVAGYPVTSQFLMSPVHAISALNKTLVMDMGFRSILPELFSLVLLTLIYFLTGAWIFNRRHLKLS